MQVQEAEKNQAADEHQKEVVEITNKLDSEIYQLEKMLNDNKDKIPESISGEFEAAIVDAKDAKDSGDLQKMKDASTKLQSIAQQMSQAAQTAQSAQEQGEATSEAADSATADDVIDVEFEE